MSETVSARTNDHGIAGEHVVVTGGAGFIGSHLVERLLHEGARVTIIDSFDEFYPAATKRRNLEQSLAHQRCRLIEADVRDAAAGLAPSERADVVVHLAARAGVRPSIEEPMLYARSNVEGTAAALEIARRLGASRFVFGSSSSVYGNAPVVPFREDDPADFPISPYAAAKRGSELFCYSYHGLYDLSVLCLRFFTVYGPRQRPDLAIHKFAKLLSSGAPLPVYGDGSNRRDFTYVADTIDGIMRGVAWTRHNRAFEIVNLGAGGSVTVRDMIDGLAGALARTPVIEWRPMQPGDVDRTWADTRKAERLLGYRPTIPFNVGIQRFAEWFLSAHG